MTILNIGGRKIKIIKENIENIDCEKYIYISSKKFMQVIPINGAYLRHILPMNLKKYVTKKSYHITYNYKKPEKGCRHNVKIIGYGKTKDKQFYWLTVIVDDQLERKTDEGVFHITLNAPNNQARKVGLFAENYKSIKSIDFGYCQSIIVQKTDPTCRAFFDLDDTLFYFSNKTIQELKKRYPEGDPWKNGLTRDGIAFTEYSKLTGLGGTVYKQYYNINIVTSRRIPEKGIIDKRHVHRGDFEKRIRKKFIELTKSNKINRVSLSVQKKKIYNKKEQAIDKINRCQKILDDKNKFFVFYDDNDEIVKIMCEKGIIVYHVKKG